ncbi:amino acid adenylation domain-containing protein [Nocardia sp. NPDC050435]|uniref:non-ribosomal peptide synthetase n=1 Tax=Nocardia sp. NPDC050435 TaxID=3155040 RepID=UPI0033F05E66
MAPHPRAEAGDYAAHPGGVSIGYPLANSDVYVLDSGLQPVPIGIVGELYLAGNSIALGYSGMSALTATRFVADIYGPPGSRMYRTGDLARPRMDGELEYVGRADDQVKIRGFRVEPREVADALTGLPGVGGAAVIVRTGSTGRPSLVGYVVPNSDALFDQNALRIQLGRRLPDYMVPAVIVEISSIPLSPNGKVDLRALPSSAPKGGGRPPATQLEARMCTLFAEALGVDEMPADGDFFAFGGHSLLAIRLIGAVRNEFGRDLPFRALYDKPTPADAVAALTESKRPALLRASLPERVPLSFAQQRLWFLHRLDPSDVTYNLPLVVRISGRIDVEILRAAVADVSERQQSLRTVFPQSTDGVPYALLVPRGAELEVLVEDDPDAAIARAARHPFDLTVDPPLRATVVRGRDDRYVLLLLLHHIAADEWSVGPLLADLTHAYRQRAAGKRPEWPQLPVRYADYAVWQRDTVAALPDSELSYWRSALAGAPHSLSLPTYRPADDMDHSDGGTVSFSIPAATVRHIRALATRTGTSVFVVLHAAVLVLLRRLGAGADLTIGTPVAGRADTVLRDLVGIFVNTVPLRVDSAKVRTFDELLELVRQADVAALDHAHVPFDLVVRELNPPRSTGSHPLFRVMLGYLADTRPSVELPGATAEVEVIGTGAAKFDLTVQVYDPDPAGRVRAGTELHCSIEYRRHLFQDRVVAAMAQQFAEILDEYSRAPYRRLVTPAELDRVLVRFNDTAIDDPIHTAPEMFAAQVAVRPEALAVVCEDERLTYAELDRRSANLAALLNERGVAPEHIVAVAVPRTVDLVVAVLGVLRAGAAYLPIDPSYPKARIAHLLSDAAPQLVLATTHTAQRLPVDDLILLDDSDLRTALAAAPARVPTAVLYPKNPAYVIYTSGSTGLPKGVVISHQGVAALVATATRSLGCTPESRSLLFASIGFDLAFFELAMALLVGGTAVVVPSHRRVPSRELTDYLSEHGVTHLCLPPAFLGALPAECSLPQDAVLLCGTEAVTPDLVHRWGSTVRFFDAYGPTEATVNSTLWRHRPGWHGTRVPIGVPDPGTVAYVLDTRMRPVPVGDVGELYLGGSGLARGYLGKQGLTSARFIANPFGPPGSRLYRTGDLVSWQDNGELDFRGRIDDQVQLRGNRVELGEVENELTSLPDVGQAAAAIRDVAGSPALIGYVVARHGRTPSAAVVRRQLRERLPDPLVPTAIVVLDVLPVTPNGKVDRDALPSPAFATGTPSRAARTPLERTLCAVFARTLDLDRATSDGYGADTQFVVGVEDSFFDLGGHSLLVVKLAAGIHAALGVDVPLATLIGHPTVAELAHHIGEPASGPVPIGDHTVIVADAMLESNVVRPDAAAPAGGRLHAPLLTGATGFVGAFLLRELVVRTDATVRCLVRAVDPISARRRIEEVMTAYGIWDRDIAHRIIAVPGDLERPRLGLDEQAWEKVAAEVDAIYHSGAKVNHVEPYDRLRAANVDGTREILRLAGARRIKPVHFVSTASVPVGDSAALPTVDLPVPALERWRTGYAASKWVAECLMEQAAGQGIPVQVYRLGRVSGHSTTGAYQLKDSIWLLARAAALLEMAPDVPADGPTVALLPVDYVSAEIVRLSTNTAGIPQVHYLNSPDQQPLRNILEVLTERYPMTFVPVAEWLDRLAADRGDRLAPARLLIPTYHSLLTGQRSTISRDRPSHTSFSPPPGDRDLLRTYVDYFQAIGFLPPLAGGKV